MYLFFEKQLDVSELTNTHHLNYTTSLVEALRLRIRNNRHNLYITIFYIYLDRIYYSSYCLQFSKNLLYKSKCYYLCQKRFKRPISHSQKKKKNNNNNNKRLISIYYFIHKLI